MIGKTRQDWIKEAIAQKGKITSDYEWYGVEHLEVGFKEIHGQENPDFKRIRDKMARELRKDGWIVKSRTVGFSDLLGATVYIFTATRSLTEGAAGDQTAYAVS